MNKIKWFTKLDSGHSIIEYEDGTIAVKLDEEEIELEELWAKKGE